MSPAQGNVGRICPECGAAIEGHEGYCWLCRKMVQPTDSVAVQPPAHVDHRAAFQFSLASLMLFVTLSAVLLGAFSVSPGTGVGLAVLSAPALVWTAVRATRRRARGRPMSPQEKVGAFAATLGSVLVICVAAGTAFFVTCLGGFWAGFTVGEARGMTGEQALGWGMLVGLLLGIAGALYVSHRVTRRYWPRQE